MVLGTYRDVEVNHQHPLSDTLAQLSRESVFRRQSLGGLSLEDAGAFMELTAGVRPTPHLIANVYRRTEGNPFFTAQVVRLLSERGVLQDPAGSEGVARSLPEGVLQVIGRRLNRLSSQCHQTLTTAAVIGREFDFRLLQLLSAGTSEEELLDIIDEALEAHLIEELPQGRERYQFCHALIQETLTQRLSSSRKVRQHARIAEALEELYGDAADAHAAEMAHHYGEAQTLLGPEKLVRYSGLAGEQALSTYAWEEALAHFERGLATMGSNLKDTAPARDANEAALLFGLARAQSAILVQDQLIETSAILKRIFEYYSEVGNIALAVAAAEFPLDNTGRVPGTAELMVRALALVPADSYEAGRLLSRYGGILGLAQCDYEGAQAALGRALSIARREGDVALEAQTLTYASDVSGQHLKWQESVNFGLRSIAQSAGHESSHSVVLSHLWTAASLLNIGDLEQARPHAIALKDLAEKRSTPRYYSLLGLVPIVTLSCLEGNWRAGREYYDHILEGASAYRQLLCARVLLEYETGEFDQGMLYLERLLEELRRGIIRSGLGKAPMTLIAVARITDMVDHLEMAKTTAEALLPEASTTPIVAMYAKASLALLAAEQDDQSATEEHYDYFLSHRGTMIWTLASADRLLGLLVQTMGNPEQAAVHFEDALTFSRKAGYRPELAWTCHDYAEALLQRSRAEDRAKTISLLDEALTISRELGMRPLMERVAARLDGLAAGSPPAPAYPDGLTQREVEVLRLIAQGRSNPEIAQELVVSIRTVTTHVSNIFSKINAANRAEAATYAIRHGLM
jgi:ATP/maltotriose-dependent transcriptional regulator MalT